VDITNARVDMFIISNYAWWEGYCTVFI
jgi:hypothetical protein